MTVGVQKVEKALMRKEIWMFESLRLEMVSWNWYCLFKRVCTWQSLNDRASNKYSTIPLHECIYLLLLYPSLENNLVYLVALEGHLGFCQENFLSEERSTPVVTGRKPPHSVNKVCFCPLTIRHGTTFCLH